MSIEISACQYFHLMGKIEEQVSELESKPVSFERKHEFVSNIKVRLLAYNPLSGEVKPRQDPPRHRDLLFAIKQSGEIVILFPAHLWDKGFHSHAESYVLAHEERQGIQAILHGSIYSEGARREKAKHVVSIYKINTPDLKSLQEHVKIREYEKGILFPENYINDHIAQAIMKSTWADSLEINPHPKSSTTLFGLR